MALKNIPVGYIKNPLPCYLKAEHKGIMLMNWLTISICHDSAFNKSIKLIILFFSISWLTACDEHNNNNANNGCDTTNYIDTGLKESLKETLESYLDTNQNNDDEPGISIVVRKDGDVVYRGNRGAANKLTETTITNDTGFVLASVSKPFTAVAILQLYEQGLLTLDDKLITYIPELSNTWEDITIHHLLSHQSGIPDLLNGDLLSPQEKDGLTNQGVIDFLANNANLEFPPGAKGEYSNTGFMLLAEIVARVAGISFGKYMETYIFSPAGMVNSYITDEKAAIRESDAINFADRDTYFGNKVYVSGAGGAS